MLAPTKTHIDDILSKVFFLFFGKKKDKHETITRNKYGILSYKHKMQGSYPKKWSSTKADTRISRLNNPNIPKKAFQKFFKIFS